MRDTRLAVLESIQHQGGATVASLAEELGISPISVRHHLTTLQAEGMVQVELQRQSVGRPRHVYRLSEAAQGYLPNSYHVLAERRQRAIPGFTIQPQSVAIGRYVGVLARHNAALRDEIDQILRQAMKDGSLEKIFRRWEVWSDDQARFYARMVSGEPVTASAGSEAEMAAPPASEWQTARRYLPSLLRASLITILLSWLSMGVAVILGIAIASGRIYGSRFTQGLLTGYVEVMRGTPLLLQLFVLYYGIADLVRLPPFFAALLGLALNYAAYESEIYRSALESVPVGQLEAVSVLGLTQRQTLALVRAPQAFRAALGAK